MRRTARLLTGTAFAAAGLATTPAYAGNTTGLDVYPATVAPGDTVTVNTAGCGGRGAAAGDATAVGAGTFMLAPSTHEGEAIGQFRVPSSAQQGTYEIVAQCAEGDKAEGGRAGGGTAADGKAEGGKRLTGDLVVTLVTAGARDQLQPHGSVKTGVGGALGPDPAHTTAGVAALAVAAAGGTWLLHRRARGDGF
ncbi:hypothetical protein ABZX30_11060 [Streptomyces sp. NPDC004542]|uniref:hypothetical protein n=1 Tax=Streptomyces sp. NPDC004542 TaxID=3154281 RepID=UPI0033A89B2F